MRIKTTLIVLFTFFISNAQEFKKVTEKYWKIENDILKATYMDDDIHHIKPFFENFIVGKELFYPSYIFDGNYETTYIYENGKLKECQTISYSKKNKNLQFKYDYNGNLISVSSPNRTLNFEYLYGGENVIVSDTQGYKAELKSKKGSVYEFKSGKTGNFIFYHYSDKIEMIVAKKQYKIIYQYSNNRLTNIKTLLKGENIGEIDIDYSNDYNGNWIKKTMKQNGKNVVIVTRNITYIN